MIWITLLTVIAWLSIGYTCWRIEYYASIKHWYVLFREDYRLYNNGNNSLRLWKRCMPGIIIGGLISYFCMRTDPIYKKYGAVWYFKIPSAGIFAQAPIKEP